MNSGSEPERLAQILAHRTSLNFYQTLNTLYVVDTIFVALVGYFLLLQQSLKTNYIKEFAYRKTKTGT